jgi:hypothetical protein
MIYAILKSNYVIDLIAWDGVTSYQYHSTYDVMVPDPDAVITIGDWYEASEGVFYRPLTTPPDYPPA